MYCGQNLIICTVKQKVKISTERPNVIICTVRPIVIICTVRPNVMIYTVRPNVVCNIYLYIWEQRYVLGWLDLQFYEYCTKN